MKKVTQENCLYYGLYEKLYKEFVDYECRFFSTFVFLPPSIFLATLIDNEYKIRISPIARFYSIGLVFIIVLMIILSIPEIKTLRKTKTHLKEIAYNELIEKEYVIEKINISKDEYKSTSDGELHKVYGTLTCRSKYGDIFDTGEVVLNGEDKNLFEVGKSVKRLYFTDGEDATSGNVWMECPNGEDD